MRAAKQGAFEGSDIALDVGRIAGCSAKDPAESGEAGVRGSIPRRSTMSSQQQADAMLAEHRAVMAALVRDSIKRPTQEEYEAQLVALRSVMSCSTPMSEPSSSSDFSRSVSF